MNQEEARGKGAWGLSANTLMSTATAEYKNLDEVRADKERLQQMPEEEYKALLEKADGQIETILSKLRSETEPHTSNSFRRTGDPGRHPAAGSAGQPDDHGHWQGICQGGLQHQQGHGGADPAAVQGCGRYPHRIL